MNNLRRTISAALVLTAASAQAASFERAPVRISLGGPLVFRAAAPKLTPQLKLQAGIPALPISKASPMLMNSAAPSAGPAQDGGAGKDSQKGQSLREGIAAAAARMESAANDSSDPDRLMKVSKEVFDSAKASGASDEGGVKGDAQKIAGLNDAIAELLKPFNDKVTRAKFAFKNAATDAKRATDVSFTAAYDKTGPKDRLNLKVKDFSYSYPDAPSAKPEFSAKVALGVDLVKMLSQEQINKMGPQADKLLQDFLGQYGSRYGAAAKLDAKITRKTTDAKGNLTALGLTMGMKIDLAKLPASVDPKSVLVTSGRITFAATLKGIEISLSAVSNPGAYQFEGGQTGLKEDMDKLLAKDPDTVKQLVSWIAKVDEMATQYVSGR